MAHFSCATDRSCEWRLSAVLTSTTWPSGAHYKIYLGDGVTKDAAGNTTEPGHVLVGPSTATGIGGSLNYDAVPNPCSASSIP